ncbi:DNA polymerase III subunit [Patescibacteria group bacterium]|nr:DNA polymerase III subunit [Patescibacteria group bacterium]MBU1682619.1 DNA polymerase III subunit [Patescibacteria group bacterium]MBU1934563.1 DNA polymerase III subunit [Patescibacteria group bacterium]
MSQKTDNQMLYKWDTIGHKKQLQQLEKEIAENNISHAYLFSGPKDVGIFRIARMFANILQCPNDLCHTCQDCKLIQSGSHPDMIVMTDNGETIKIDDVRDLIHKTNLTSYGKHRIILIENIERMPIEAQNSFLKTLEEPAGKTIFILTSNKINQVLPTIKSRVRRYSFYSVEDGVLKKYLQEKFGDNSDLDEIIQISQGRPGLAINLIKSPTILTEQRSIYNQIEFFLKKNNLSQKFMFVETLDQEPEQLELFFDAFSRYLRKLVYEYLSSDNHALKSRFTLEDIANLFESLEKTRYLIERNTNKKLALENFFLLTER